VFCGRYEQPQVPEASGLSRAGASYFGLHRTFVQSSLIASTCRYKRDIRQSTPFSVNHSTCRTCRVCLGRAFIPPPHSPFPIYLPRPGYGKCSSNVPFVRCLTFHANARLSRPDQFEKSLRIRLRSVLIRLLCMSYRQHPDLRMRNPHLWHSS
jgi:hypothetical protein